MTTTETTEISTQPASILDSVGADYGIGGADLYNALAETIFPSKQAATKEQVQALLIVAKQHGLSPFSREIYAFPAKGKGVVPIVSVDGWYKLANSHPQMDGMKAEPVYEDGKLVAYSATIYRKDRSHPTHILETLEENKRNTDPWRNQPNRMLRHRALVQAIRVTFGFAGIFDPDEGARIAYPDHEVVSSNPAIDKQEARLAKPTPKEEEAPVDPDNAPGDLTYQPVQAEDTSSLYDDE